MESDKNKDSAFSSIIKQMNELWNKIIKDYNVERNWWLELWKRLENSNESSFNVNMLKEREDLFLFEPNMSKDILFRTDLKEDHQVFSLFGQLIESLFKLNESFEDKDLILNTIEFYRSYKSKFHSNTTT